LAPALKEAKGGLPVDALRLAECLQAELAQLTDAAYTLVDGEALRLLSILLPKVVCHRAHVQV
jgi:hypothetical protein